MNQISSGTLNREQGAKYLGVSLPVFDRFLHRSVNPIPCFRAGKRYIIPQAGLEEWLAAEAQRQYDGRCEK